MVRPTLPGFSVAPMTATFLGEKKTSSGWLRFVLVLFLLVLLVVACIFVGVRQASERGGIERLHHVADIEAVLSRYGFDIAVVAHRPVMQIFKDGNSCGMTLFHVPDDHVAANQLIESKHSGTRDSAPLIPQDARVDSIS